jgi:hypothetical protein
LEAAVGPQDRDRVRAAIATSVVADAAAGRRLESAADLLDAVQRLTEARTYVRDFGQLYRRIGVLRKAADREVGEEAERILVKQFTSSASLALLNGEVDELVRRWKPSPLPTPPPVRVGRARISVPPPGSAAPLRPLRPRGGRGVALAVAAALVLLSCAVLTYVGVAPKDAAVPQATESVHPAPTVGTQPAAPSALPEAPVSTPAAAPPAPVVLPSEPTIAEIVWFGGVLPVLAAALAGLAGWWAWRAWRRRARRRVPLLEAASLERQVRLGERRFTVVASALVVLGGMSVLYASDPTFGSAADYLATGLWAAGFGEGLTLIRRFWPAATG